MGAKKTSQPVTRNTRNSAAAKTNVVVPAKSVTPPPKRDMKPIRQPKFDDSENEGNTSDSEAGHVEHPAVVKARLERQSPKSLEKKTRVVSSCISMKIIRALQNNLDGYCDVSLKDLKVISETLIKTIVALVKNGKRVCLTNHMTFTRKWMARRQAFVPSLGKIVTVPGHYTMGMKLRAQLKAAFAEIPYQESVPEDEDADEEEDESEDKSDDKDNEDENEDEVEEEPPKPVTRRVKTAPPKKAASTKNNNNKKK